MDTDQAKAEAVRIARGILDGEVGLVSGCRAVQHPLAILGLRMDEESPSSSGWIRNPTSCQSGTSDGTGIQMPCGKSIRS
jgi:hypothetical protein